MGSNLQEKLLEVDFDRLSIDRRGFLRGLSILAAGAAFGLGSSPLSSASAATVRVQDRFVFDNEMKTIMTHHRIHCHGSCMLKAYVKNGRLLKLTSVGDIPREGSQKFDEDVVT
ncbi:MAG: twin-arginine translocation signal domain-containing protein [Nitrospirae bacterium]|nr:twin-arginine translocation signal domain-containing protein [Nitrospirota bacterium]